MTTNLAARQIFTIKFEYREKVFPFRQNRARKNVPRYVWAESRFTVAGTLMFVKFIFEFSFYALWFHVPYCTVRNPNKSYHKSQEEG